MPTTVSNEHMQVPNIIINTYLHFEFGLCDCCKKPTGKKEYIPIFGVGGLTETSIWAVHARPIKLTTYAIDYYKIEKTEPVTIEKTEQVVLPIPACLIGKRVGVVRRIVENGVKINKYHCPTYKLISIELSHFYSLCTAKVMCYNTGETEEVVIERLAIPELLEYT